LHQIPELRDVPNGFSHDAPEGNAEVSNGEVVEEGVDVTRAASFGFVNAVHGHEVAQKGKEGHDAQDEALANGIIVQGRGMHEACEIPVILHYCGRVVLTHKLFTLLRRKD